VFLYYADHFKKPNPFRPDVVAIIDGVIDKKLEAVSQMESQFLEGGVSGHEGRVPKDEVELAARRKEVQSRFRRRFAAWSERYRATLIEMVGEAAGKKARFVEAFEVCEYGRRPTTEELKQLFPFFGE
jgi:hypothetical protein